MEVLLHSNLQENIEWSEMLFPKLTNQQKFEKLSGKQLISQTIEFLSIVPTCIYNIFVAP